MLSSITLNSPWYYYLISALGAFGLSFWLYFRNSRNKDAPKYTLYLLGVLRFLSTFLIVLFLLNILLKRIQNQTQNPIVLLAIDNSSSMTSAKDSLLIKTRFIEELKKLQNGVSEKFEVKTILFGSSNRQSNETPLFNEKETDIDGLIRDVENNYSGENIGALVIASDGIYNKGINPLYSIEKLGFPIYCIATGDTTENKDVFIQKINHNQVAYLGNNFPVEVLVGAKKLKNVDLVIGLYQNGVLKSEQKIKTGSDSFSGACNFTLNASSTGLVRYNVVVKNPDGEKNISNNSQSFVVEVIDNRDKILLLANNPHPDVFAIKDALSGFGNYELEYGLTQNFNKPIKAYSLVIIEGFSNANVNLINDCKAAAIPFWIVNPATVDNLPGLKISGWGNRFNDAELTLNSSFGLFGLSEGFVKFANDLPAIKTFFGNYQIGNGSSSLINQRIGSVETENPVLLFTELNGLKCAVFAGDGLWRWKMRDFAEHNNHLLFNELIGKTVQYLVVKSDKSFFRINPPKIVNENESIEFGAEVYNQSYEAITEQDVNLIITNSEKKKFNYAFSKNKSSYKLNIGQLPAGDYAYEASVKNNNQLMLKKGNFSVKEVLSEKINSVANHQLLFQLANRTKGKVFYPNQTNKLKEALLGNETIKPITYSQNNVTPLIEQRWLIGLIILLLASEWFLRKRHLQI
ncbi:MAG: VWA domain-containing protein [Bacteroidia bacterium]|nr:VWA domain-containing protein [Bacteroidia bacterium]